MMKETEILPTLSSGHSPILSKGKGFGKFNNSLLLNEEFVAKMKKDIHFNIKESNSWNINVSHRFDRNVLNEK